MRYILYARKSTEEDDRQVLSIESQISELKEFAVKEKLKIVFSIWEAKTAKEPGRIKFAEMVEMIENGKADGILSWHPDRLARNSIDGGKLIHLIDKGLLLSLKFPTFWFEPTPQGLFMLNIAFGQSKYYVDNLSENTKRGQRQKIRNGWFPGWAPIGYINELKTHTIVIDSVKGEKVKQLFELYSIGNYTLYALVNWASKNNLTNRLEKPLRISNVYRILQNPFYTGLIRWHNELFEGAHIPLISKKLFDTCQEVMRNRGRVQKQKKHNFLFTGLMKCYSCGASITAEIQKGHIYYRCTKKIGVCDERHYLREEHLIEQIRTIFQKVALSSRDTEKVLFELKKDENEAKQKFQTTIEKLKHELSQIETRLEKLLDIYLENTITTQEYTERKSKLINEKQQLRQEIDDYQQSKVSWLEPAKEFVLNLNKAHLLQNSGNLPEFSPFFKNVGSNHHLHRRQLAVSFRKPYDSVSQIDRNNLTIPIWQRQGESNPCCQDENLVS